MRGAKFYEVHFLLMCIVLTHLSLASFFYWTKVNSGDPDQTPQNAASDQGLNCLLKPPFHWTTIPLRFKILVKMTRIVNPPFHWTAILLHSWRSRIFSKIIPNRRWSVDSHTIWGLDASSTLSVRFHYASVSLLLISHYDNEDLATLSLRWWRCSCDLATTLLRPWRWSYAFVALLYPFFIDSEIPIRFYYDQDASTALSPFLLRIVSVWPKFRIVAESPSSGMGGGGGVTEAARAQ